MSSGSAAAHRFDPDRIPRRITLNGRRSSGLTSLWEMVVNATWVTPCTHGGA